MTPAFKLHGPYFKLAILAISILLSGCSTLPSFGPSSDAILDAAINEQANTIAQAKFSLVDLSPATLPQIVDHRPKQFSNAFTDQQRLRIDEHVSPGDLINVRIWEASDDGLFANNGKREVSFTLTVSNSGKINVPHAGSVLVEKQSTEQIRDVLLKRYQGKAVTPEISVQIKQTTSRGVSVLGAASSPGRINIPPNGLKILDLLALAGGIQNPAWECTLTLTREGRSETVALDWLISSSNNNVIVLPGDIIHVDHIPRNFAVYGAVTKPGNISIQKPTALLTDILANAGGLDDMQAEANSVFIFRTGQANETTNNSTWLSYRLNMSRPDAFILSSQFKVEDTDIIYVATADASQFRKFVTTLFSPLLGSASRLNNLGN